MSVPGETYSVVASPSSDISIGDDGSVSIYENAILPGIGVPYGLVDFQVFRSDNSTAETVYASTVQARQLLFERA